MRRSNPYLERRKTNEVLLSTIQAQLDFWGEKLGTYKANVVLEDIQKADPTKEKVFSLWLVQCFIAACGNNTVEDFFNDLGVAKEYLTIWVKGQADLRDGEWVEKSTNEPWAKILTSGDITSIAQLGSLLVDLGLLSTQFQGDWVQQALFLQKNGDCYILGDGQDADGNTWLAVDLITHKAATELGENSGWCTSSGAFYNYIPRTGLIMGYCVETGERLQITSRNKDNAKSDDDDDDDYDYDERSYDGYFEEQKLPNNVVFQFEGRYKPLLKLFKRVCDQVQARVRIAEGGCLIRALDNLRKGGGQYVGKHKLVFEAYEGNINMPPLKVVYEHGDRLLEFMTLKKINNAARREYDFLLKYIPSNLFTLELALTRHPIIVSQFLKPYFFDSFVTIPKGKYKTLSGEVIAELRGFDISKYETTQVLWAYVTQNSRPIQWSDSALTPIVNVSWFDACEFCNILSELADKEPCYDLKRNSGGEIIDVDWHWNADGYRLPTEAEWEAAARDNTDYTYAGSNNPDEVAWYSENSQNRVHPVGEKKPNTLGLYDMSGNVWEWCYDSYGSISDKVEMPD